MLAGSAFTGTLVESLMALLLLTVVTVLVGLVVAPLGAVLGALVAPRPVLSLPRGSSAGGLRRRVDTVASLRELGAVVAVLVLACTAVGVVQYTDPTSPTVGDGPAYAGVDAPAAEQVAQAQARTRSHSYTATATTVSYGPNGSRDRERPVTFVFEHDLERDVVRIVTSGVFGSSSTLVTEDAIWYWDGNGTNPAPSEMRPNEGVPRPSSVYGITAVTDAPARVVDTTADTVTVRYSSPASRTGEAYDYPGNRTVTIDRSTGRLVAIETVLVREDGRSVVRTTTFEDYGTTAVERIDTPVRPFRLQVYDVLLGPLNGETPMHT